MKDHDVLLTMTNDKYTFTPITNKAKEQFDSDMSFTAKQAEFFVSANLAHFENIGLTIKVDDKRSKDET